jgi:hypothetical protein
MIFAVLVKISVEKNSSKIYSDGIWAIFGLFRCFFDQILAKNLFFFLNLRSTAPTDLELSVSKRLFFYLHDAKCIRVRFRIDLGNFGWSSETALGHLLNSARNRHHDFSLSENLNSCFWAVLQILGVISPQAQFSKAPGLYKERSEDQNNSEQKNRLSDKNKGRDLDKEQAWISSDSESFFLNHWKINSW